MLDEIASGLGAMLASFEPATQLIIVGSLLLVVVGLVILAVLL